MTILIAPKELQRITARLEKAERERTALLELWEYLAKTWMPQEMHLRIKAVINEAND